MGNRMPFVLLGAVLTTAGCSTAAAPPPKRDPWDVVQAALRNERLRFNEGNARMDLSLAASAQANFAIDADAHVDPGCLAQKGGAVAEALPPKTWRGYRTTFHSGPRSSAAGGCGVTAYAYLAVPLERGETGLRSFCVDDTIEMRASTTAGLPVMSGGRCPRSWALVEAVPFPVEPVSDADRRAGLKALDDDPRSKNLTAALKERVRALLGGDESAAPKTGRAHAKGVNTLAFTPDGRSLVSGGLENPELKLWSLPGGRLSQTWTEGCGRVTRMLVAPDADTLVASCGDQSVKLVSLTTGKVTATLGSYGTGMVFLSATGDRRSVLTTAKGKATVVALPAGTRGASLDVGELTMTVAALSRDGAVVAAGSLDDPVRLWTLPGGQLRGDLGPSPGVVGDLAFSPDGRLLAGGFEDGSVCLWDTGKRRRVWIHKEHGGTVNGVSFTPDGTSLLSASSDHTVKVWSIPLGELTTTLRGHDAALYAVTVSADGRMAASGDASGGVMLWELASGASLALTDPAVR